jgi:hypothetical protein
VVVEARHGVNDVNEKTEDWRTRLQFAMDRQQVRMDAVRYLLQKGA